MNDANRTQVLNADPNRTRMGGPPLATVAFDANKTMMGAPPSLNATQTVKPTQCPVCRSHNPAGLMFCDECGLIFDRALPADAFGAPAVQLPQLVETGGREHPVRPGETTIGREGDILVSEGRASRRHAKIVSNERGLTVEDLGSTNGTKVDGAPLTPGQPRELRGGETISIGGFELRLVLPGGGVGGNTTQALPGANATQALGNGKTQAFNAARTQVIAAPPRTESAPATLVAKADGKEFPLRAGTTTFGRRDGNDVVIPDPHVSGAHGRFEIGADGVFVTDLGSSNGTFVNGAKLGANARTRLSPNDEVRIGRLDFTVRAA